MRTSHQLSPVGERKQPTRAERGGTPAGVAATIRWGAALAVLLLCGCAGHGTEPGRAALREADLESLAAAYGVRQATAVATAPEGSHYLLDAEATRIYRFGTDGTVLVLPLENKEDTWQPETLSVDDIGNLTVAGRSPQQRSVYDTGGHRQRRSPSLAGAVRPPSPPLL